MTPDGHLEADYESRVTGDFEDDSAFPLGDYKRFCDVCGERLSDDDDELCSVCEGEVDGRVNDDIRFEGFLDRWDDDPSPYSGTYSEE